MNEAEGPTSMGSADSGHRLQASRDHCRNVARSRAGSFYPGMRLVPGAKRAAMEALYAWMRSADDLADGPGQPAEKRERLLTFQQQTRRAITPGAAEGFPEGPIWPAVHEMMTRYPVEPVYLEQMIEGQLADLEPARYASFEELYDYCYKVASVVGLSCIEIWGYRGGEETRQLSQWRGIAFQLTNILRDVMEDARRDRIYIPAQMLDAFEATPQVFLMGDRRDARRAMLEMADRAETYYRRSNGLERKVHRDGRPCLRAMTDVYRGLLRQVRRNPDAVLAGRRAGLGTLRKRWIGLRAVLGRTLAGFGV